MAKKQTFGDKTSKTKNSKNQVKLIKSYVSKKNKFY